MAAEKRSEIPNLVFSTTYNLDKIGLVSMCMGLEYIDGYYCEVAKLTGTWNKNITLDPLGWKMIRDNFELITAFFENSHQYYTEFGKTATISLPLHQINFVTSHNEKYIAINEIASQREIEKKKADDPNAQPTIIVLKEESYQSLKAYSTIIDLVFKKLEKYAYEVNLTLEHVVEYFKNKIMDETEEERYSILQSYGRFKHLYSTLSNSDLINFVVEKTSNASYRKQCLKIVLYEILTFDLHFVYKDLCETMDEE